MDTYNPKMAATDRALDSVEALRLLRRIDVIHEKLDGMPVTAAKYGAMGGAISGGVTGGVVAAGIAFAKAKLGF